MSNRALSPPEPEPYQVWAQRYYKLENDLVLLKIRIERLEREVERYSSYVEGLKMGLARSNPEIAE